VTEKAPLHVFTDSELAGTLTRSDVEEDTFLFDYRPGCVAEHAVSLTMPIRADQYDSSGGLLPIFDMNLPEGALRERLRLQFAKAIPAFDDVDLLGIVGASQIGRLRYSSRPALDASIPAQSLDEILTYRGAADLFAHLLDRFAIYSGISGVQPKVLIRDAEHPDKVTVRGATHIVKTFDPAEYPELAANELICTVGASAAGIVTARVRLSDNRRFLVVDRFDLTPDGRYLALEDICVLDGRRAHGRYDGSYEGIARRLSQFVSPSELTRAREQFALQVVYACAIGNGDAHLKNFSVRYRHPEDVVELAPAYDLVSTRPYLPRDSLALTMDGSKQFPDRQRMIRFVRHVVPSKLFDLTGQSRPHHRLQQRHRPRHRRGNGAPRRPGGDLEPQGRHL
jgi:serine/threonine-protein kinase HipA